MDSEFFGSPERLPLSDRDFDGGAAHGPSEGTPATSVSFMISGLTCSSDSIRLENRLERRLGVRYVTVNLVTEAAYITFDPTVTDPAALRRAIEQAGFSAEPR